MSEFSINKGVDGSVEFKGLKAQYLFIFVGGLLALFIVFVVMYMVGVSQVICIAFGGISATILVWQTFSLNAKYGEHGLMKLSAQKRFPRFLLNKGQRTFIKFKQSSDTIKNQTR